MEFKATKRFPIESIEIDFELDFCINEAKIYTTNKIPYSKKLSEKVFLVIEVWTQLDAIDSPATGLLYVRPTTLILLSVISYLLDYPLTIYEFSGSGAIGENGIASDERPNKLGVSKFIHNQIDKSSDLLKILEAIYMNGEGINEFIVSVLSRWHKARYLEKQSDASLYYAEGFLVYFHIIELCSDRYSDEQTKEAEDRIKQFVKELLSNTFKFRGKHLEDNATNRYKIIRSNLLSDISITSKMCYFLDRLELLNPKTQYFVEQLVKIRNTIAHGRYVNHEKLNWPLPPFLLINDDAGKFIFAIRIFTGHVIGSYLSIEAWLDRWTDVHSWLHPPPEAVKKFVHGNFFESITPTDFIRGTIDCVRPSSVVEQFLMRKIKFQELEMSLKLFLLDVEVDQSSAPEIFEAAIILVDSLDKKLSDRCRSLVADIHRNELLYYSNIKDIIREIEQREVEIKLIWFREWIETGGAYQSLKPDSLQE